ncbi:hypothetical protein F5X97DRAFT_228084 [Nemania serpens]|nr:hypothetical protein F5X97DRAFT_228084 [Nemania serpens]
MADPFVDLEASPKDEHVNPPPPMDNQTDMALSNRPLRIRIIRAAPFFTHAVIMALKWLAIQRTVPRQYPNNADSPAPVSPIPPAALFCLSTVLGFSILLEPYSRYLRRLRILNTFLFAYTWWMVQYINWYMNTLFFTFTWWMTLLFTYTWWMVQYINWYMNTLFFTFTWRMTLLFTYTWWTVEYINWYMCASRI